MKFIVIILFQIFLLVLELESTSYCYNLTINKLDLMMCQTQSSKCRSCSTTCNDVEGENMSNKNCDLFQGIFECVSISTKSISSNCPLNTPTECMCSTITDDHKNSLTPTRTKHQTPGTTQSLLPTEMSTSSQQSLCIGSATNTSKTITQAEALGAIVGLSAMIIILFIVAIIGWVCTCLALKKKGSMNINKTNNSEMETRYHGEIGNTQQESNEDQLQRDLNDERAHFYDIIPPTNATPAVAHNTATTNTEEASTEQHTYTATDRQQQIWNKNNPPPGHPPPLGDRDAVGGSSYEQGQNQTTTPLGDGNPEDSNNVHIYHVLEEPQSTTKKEIELKDHNPPAAYEVPVANTAVKQS